jgi:hypothetical protein
MNNAELQERKRIARHEALHGLLGLRAGGTIEDIIAWPYGETSTRFQLNPWTLKSAYARAPAATQETASKILAAFLGPSVLMYGEVLGGGDLELCQQWLSAWEQLPTSCTWRDLRAEAILDAMDWYRPRRAFVERVAMALMQRRKVWGDRAWRKLVEDCRPPQAPRRTAAAPSRPAAHRQRALTNSIRVEHLTCFPDWRTSGHAGTALVHQS